MLSPEIVPWRSLTMTLAVATTLALGLDAAAQ